MKKLSGFLAFFALVSPFAEAGYFDLTHDRKEPQECITFDVRYPYWTKGIYIATYPGHARSKEGWTAPYYGGVVSDKDAKDQLIQFASWQMGGKGAPATGIDFIHAGPYMSWKRSNWEGSSGGIKGKWPNDKFKPGEWYRFFHRTWTPESATPHLGYAGVWMKNLTTGEWFHLATFKFPAELTGFNNMGGFTEFFTNNASDSCSVEFRNVYAMRSSKWVSEPDFTAWNHFKDTITLTPSSDKSSVTLETTRTPKDTAGKHTEVPVTHQKATLIQPETPGFFDRAAVVTPAAEGLGDRVLVRWRIDSKAAPQLGYKVELLAKDKVVAAAAEKEPEARLAVFTLPPGTPAPTKARIVISDIFGNESEAATFTIAAAVPAAATTKIGTAPGLDYRYFESEKPGEWTATPDFDKLTPKRTGVTATPDITPRLRRADYGFTYSGDILAPRDGLYVFDVVAACGARLLIDGKPVIDDGEYHSIRKSEGTIALKAGGHRIRLDYYQGRPQSLQADDFLNLSWSGPGFARTAVTSSYLRHPAADTAPKVTALPRVEGSGGINLTLTSKVGGLAGKAARVEYYANATTSDYFAGQDARGAEYLLATSDAPDKPASAVIWGGAGRSIRARLVTDDGRTFDSAPVALPDSPDSERIAQGPQPLKLTVLEHHLYPPAFSIDAGSVTLVGESMNLLTAPMKGDGTLIARLAGVTDGNPQPDGTTPQEASNWFAGIILRNNLDARPGEPLGGSKIPFSAVMGSANKQTRHCDSTMINGAGNQPSGDVGGDCRWYKIERRGTDFTTSISKDGREWKVIKTVQLPKASETMEAGFVLYSIPSSTPRVHWAKFDNISLSK